MHYHTIIEFWFREIDSKSWWTKDPEFDRLISARFGACHRAATRCELYVWRNAALGRLAEIIVLDQFTRNMYRDAAAAFTWDAVALALAQEAVLCGADQELDPARRSFLYMPYMHSESLVIHEQAEQLYGQPGLEYNLDFERRHKRIIERFGRYPHRNLLLQRTSSAEEEEFLKGPGSSF